MKKLMSFRPRRAWALALSALAFATGACSSDAVGLDDDHEIHVESMRLTIAGQTVTIAANGDVTGAPVTLAAGSHAVSAVFLNDQGVADPAVNAIAFQLDVSIPSGSPAVFARSTTNAFAGTLTVTGAATAVAVRFSLRHVEENHEDFGPFPVTFNFTN